MPRVARPSGGAFGRMLARASGSVIRGGYRVVLKTLPNGLLRTRVGAVGFGDLRRLQPISANFGYDRGKPLDRRYIEDFLSRNAEDIKGRVLEVADNAYTMRFGGTRVTQSDILHANADDPRATVVGDLAEGDNFPLQAFDCIVLTQTLHFIFDMEKAVATLHRMLKPGGVLLVTVPGISCIEHNRSWPPLWTLSPTALRRLLEERFGKQNVSASAYGNVFAAVAFLHGLAESELQPSELDTHDPEYPVTVVARATRGDEK
jgi:SAM-dependent methyltransferase